MRRPLVSVCMPAYNAEEYVADALDSALGQTWPELEIIVVNDGSTDGTANVLDKYREEYSQVTVFHQGNKGASAARNRAFEAATGAYVQYLDADDLLHPRKVEAQVTALEASAPGRVAVCSTVYFQDGEPPESGKRAKGEKHIPWLTSDDPVQWLINLWTPDKGWGMVQPGAWLVPCEVIEEAGPWREDISLDDDGEFFTRALLASNGIRYIEEGCVYYRHHDQARLSGSNSRHAYESLLRSLDSKRAHLLPRANDSNREDAAFVIARKYWNAAVRTLPMYRDIAKKASDRARSLGLDEPPESVLPATDKGQMARYLMGWKAARYLQYWYRRLTSDTV